MATIKTFLWFDTQAEEAAQFYTSVFPEAKMGAVSRAGAAGAVIGVEFTLLGQAFHALNGGTQYKFTPAISFFINCATQQEVDYYWYKLGEGGKEVQCGWLQDKFGLSWQVVPAVLGKLLGDPDKQKSQRVMQAMRSMVKLDIAALQHAYDG